MLCRTGHRANAFPLAAGSSSGPDHAAHVPRPAGTELLPPPSTCSAQRDPEPDSNAAADGQNGVTWAGGELEDLYPSQPSRPCPKTLVYETLAPGERAQGLPVSETRVRNQRLTSCLVREF